MQRLALFSWCIYTAIVFLPAVHSSSGFLERALFDVAPDVSLFSSEPSLEDISLWNQDTGLDSNGLLVDNPLDPIIDFDSNQYLAANDYPDDSASNFLFSDSDVACGVDNAEKTDLLGIVRRENLCREPQVGQAGKPDDSGQLNPAEAFQKLFTITDPLAPFPSDSQLCSRREFDNSNIPVCKEEFPPEDIVPIPRTRAFSLFNIDPSTFESIPPRRHSQPSLIDSAKLNPLPFYHYVLQVLHYGVAKASCGPYVFL